jgi:hypothetical protein
MKKKPKQISLRGDSKPSLDLVPQNQLQEASAGAGAGIDPSGLPGALTPSGRSGSKSSSS